MSRYIKEVVASFPAYDVIKPRKCSLTGLPVFKANDVVAVSGSRNYKMYTFGSVVSYAIANNDDPIESYNSSVACGHDLYWLNKNCVSITSNNEAKETYLELNIGDEILFEGIVFRIDANWDKSPKLVPISSKDEYVLI